MFKEKIREMMAEYPNPLEWCAHRARFVGIYSLDIDTYDDPAMQKWIETVAQVLSDHELICRCEEEFLSGDVLEKRRWYAANERRRQKRDRLRAENE